MSGFSFAWLQRLDPPKQPGESRFEGVLPNLRGLKIAVAYMGLFIGLSAMMWIAGFIFLL